jgi:hypothetical protein
MSWEKKIEYWENTWETVLDPDNPRGWNIKKMSRLIKEMSLRPHYAKLKKLEIGCGPGAHADIMGEIYTNWNDNWMGVDVSTLAVEHAQSLGLDARVAAAEKFQTDERFELFILLDVLEHIQERYELAENIARLAEENFFIFGNIPLFGSKHPAYVEELLDGYKLGKFLRRAGCKHVWVHIWGANLNPFMMFEGRTTLKGPPLERLVDKKIWYAL